MFIYMQFGGMNPVKLWIVYGEQLREKFASDRSARNFVNATEIPPAFVYKKYSEWIVRSYIRGGIKLYEDIRSRVHPEIDLYEQLLKHKDKVEVAWMRDITQFCGIAGCKKGTKSVPGLSDYLDEYRSLLEEVHKEEHEEKMQPIYEDESFTLYHPQTEAQACHVGRGTRWCTAAKKDNMFENYNSRGALFVIVPKNREYPKEKYQFFRGESGQYMNDRDEPLLFSEFLRKFPGILKAAVSVPILEYFFKPIAVLGKGKRQVTVFSSLANENDNSEEVELVFYNNERILSHEESLKFMVPQLEGESKYQLYKIGETDFFMLSEGVFIDIRTHYSSRIELGKYDAVCYSLKNYFFNEDEEVHGLIFYIPVLNRYIMDYKAVETGLIKPKAINVFLLRDTIYIFHEGRLHPLDSGYINSDNECWLYLLTPEGVPLIPRNIIYRLEGFYSTGRGFDRIDYIWNLNLAIILYVYNGIIFHMDHPPVEVLEQIMDEGKRHEIFSENRFGESWRLEIIRDEDMEFVSATYYTDKEKAKELQWAEQIELYTSL
jgi:hypothetical protein